MVTLDITSYDPTLDLFSMKYEQLQTKLGEPLMDVSPVA